MPIVNEYFPAFSPKAFHLQGNFFLLRKVLMTGTDTPASVNVSFFRDGQKLPEELFEAAAGDGAQPAGGFDYIELDTGSFDADISFWVSDGFLRSSIVTGTIRMLDLGRDRVDSAAAFLGGARQVAVAGVNSLVQLYRKALAGPYCYVKQIDIAVPAAVAVSVRHDPTARGALSGTNWDKRFLGVSSSYTELRAGTNAGVLGSMIMELNLPGPGTYCLKFDEPLRCSASHGITVMANAVNLELAANFHSYEST